MTEVYAMLRQILNGITNRETSVFLKQTIFLKSFNSELYMLC